MSNCSDAFASETTPIPPPVFATYLGTSIYSHVRFVPCHIPDNATGTTGPRDKGLRRGAGHSRAAAISIASVFLDMIQPALRPEVC